MNEKQTTTKVLNGLFWKLMENGGAQGVQFLVSIILARLLSPEEYGVVGVILIFVTIANVLVQNGFSTALIQKRKVDDTDFSSVFFFNMAVSAVIYLVLFGGARHRILLPQPGDDGSGAGAGRGPVSGRGNLHTECLCVQEYGV